MCTDGTIKHTRRKSVCVYIPAIISVPLHLLNCEFFLVLSLPDLTTMCSKDPFSISCYYRNNRVVCTANSSTQCWATSYSLFPFPAMGRTVILELRTEIQVSANPSFKTNFLRGFGGIHITSFSFCFPISWRETTTTVAHQLSWKERKYSIWKVGKQHSGKNRLVYVIRLHLHLYLQNYHSICNKLCYYYFFEESE